MTKKSIALAVAAALGGLSFASASQAGGVTYKDGDKYMKLGGRIQLQYHYEDPDSGDSSDELFFRRLRPYIEGSLHPDWKGKFQWDMGESKKVTIKDAYMEYKGFHNIKVRLGNAYAPFSREALTSSKYQQLVERTFVGDHNYGTPDRNLGLHLLGHNDGKTVTWGASVSEANIDPDNKKLDFDTPVNKGSDFNQGWMVSGRVDFHPFGILKMSQGDFKREQKATIGVGAYAWSNDDDVKNVTTSTTSTVDTTGAGCPTACPVNVSSTTTASTKDVDSVNGYEISGAYRNKGLSVDAEYNRFDAELKDGTVTSGIYKKGETTLSNWAVEGGYMVMPGQLEVVAGYQSQDADNYDETWDRYSFGLNWFVHKHDVKYQLTYRQNKNKDGVDGSDESEVFAQAQYVF